MMLDWSKHALKIAALASSVDTRMLVSLPATPAARLSCEVCSTAQSRQLGLAAFGVSKPNNPWRRSVSATLSSGKRADQPL